MGSFCATRWEIDVYDNCDKEINHNDDDNLFIYVGDKDDDEGKDDTNEEAEVDEDDNIENDDTTGTNGKESNECSYPNCDGSLLIKILEIVRILNVRLKSDQICIIYVKQTKAI